MASSKKLISVSSVPRLQIAAQRVTVASSKKLISVSPVPRLYILCLPCLHSTIESCIPVAGTMN